MSKRWCNIFSFFMKNILSFLKNKYGDKNAYFDFSKK